MTDANATTDKLPTPLPTSSASTSVTNTTPIEGQLLETTAKSVKPGWKTSEFWLSIAAKILGALFAAGYLGDGSSASRVAGIAAIILSTLGYQVSRTMVKNAAMLMLFVAIVHTQTACAWFKSESKAVAADVIDCTKGAAPGAIAEFGPAIDALLVYATGGGGQLDASQVGAAAKNFGKSVGGCVLADAVARALKPAPTDPNAPKASPLVADPSSLHAAIAQLYPGAKFHTASGDL